MMIGICSPVTERLLAAANMGPRSRRWGMKKDQPLRKQMLAAANNDCRQASARGGPTALQSTTGWTRG